MKLSRFLFLAFIITMSGCGSFSEFMKYNSDALSDVRIAKSDSSIIMERSVRLEVPRGMLGDVYVSYLPKGKYKKVLESSMGSYYFSENEKFYYNGGHAGGLYIPNNSQTAYIWVMSSTSREDAEYKLNDSDEVEKFKNFSSIKPIIDTDFSLNSDQYHLN